MPEEIETKMNEDPLVPPTPAIVDHTPKSRAGLTFLFVFLFIISAIGNAALGYGYKQKDATILAKETEISTKDQAISTKDALISQQKESIDAYQDTILTNSNCPVVENATTACPVTQNSTPAPTTTAKTGTSSIIQPPPAPRD